MIWQSPWVLAGLVSLALPILIHLLGRGRANLQQFPTLRFIERSRLLPTRRTTVHDPLLLLIRLAILTCAVAALALPRWNTDARTKRLNATVARVVILDSSASMLRLTPSGVPALLDAEAKVAALTDGPFTQVLRTMNVSNAIPGAVHWLSEQPGRAEIVIISDFQIGTIDSTVLTSIPPSVGISLQQVQTSFSLPETRGAQIGDWYLTASANAAAGRMQVTWHREIAPLASPLLASAGQTEASALAASLAAANSLPLLLPVDSVEQVRVILGSTADREQILAGATPPSIPWMWDFLARVDKDPLLEAGPTYPNNAADSFPPSVLPLRLGNLAAMVGVASTRRANSDQLIILAPFPPGSLPATTFLAAVNRARSHAAPPTEMSLETITAATLLTWGRTASEVGSRPTTSGAEPESDGRWLWFAALLLLAIEAFIRRRRSGPGSENAPI